MVIVCKHCFGALILNIALEIPINLAVKALELCPNLKLLTHVTECTLFHKVNNIYILRLV